jgi:hypothetical protein
VTPLSPAETLRLKAKIVETFNNERWQELGLLTNCADIINQHDRLLRSLAWGDSDYSGNVLTVITAIIHRNPANAEIIRSYVDDGLDKSINVSSLARHGPKIVFQPGVFDVPSDAIDPKLVAVMMPFYKAFDDVYLSIGLAAATFRSPNLRRISHLTCSSIDTSPT